MGALLPASVLGAWLIYIITLFLNGSGSSLYMGHSSIWYWFVYRFSDLSDGWMLKKIIFFAGIFQKTPFA